MLKSIDEEFQQHQGILHWQVQQLITRCKSVEYDDAFQVASVAFIRAYRTYDDSKKCKFSTYLTFVVRNDMISLLEKEARRWGKTVPLVEEIDPQVEEKECVDDFLVQFLPQLSPKSQKFVKDILIEGRRYRPTAIVKEEVLGVMGYEKMYKK